MIWPALADVDQDVERAARNFDLAVLVLVMWL